jgi:2-iminobutanoate/2-iminopropanoate deaminase
MKPQHLTVGSGSTFGGAGPIFSDAVRFGELLFLSGRAPVDPGTLQVRSGSFEEQAHAVLDDVGNVLEHAGSRWDHVLRVECFLADAADFAAWNQLWLQHFSPPRPARTTVVSSFAVPGIKLELQVIAAIADEQ